MELVAIALGTFAVLAWISAVAHGLLLLRHRKPGKSSLWFAVRGYAMFDPQHFEPSGHPLQRRLLVSFFAFFAFIGGSMILAVSRAGAS